LNELKRAIRKFQRSDVIFDTREKVSTDMLVNKGGRQFDSTGNAISGPALAKYTLTNEALEIERINAEGVWEVEVRPNGRAKPTAARSTDSERLFEVTFEAKVSDLSHVVRCVSINADSWKWIDHTHFFIQEKNWRPYNATLKGQANLNILIRIQDEINQIPAGTLYLRNISVRLV
jgi:hypothetical protein